MESKNSAETWVLMIITVYSIKITKTIPVFTEALLLFHRYLFSAIYEIFHFKIIKINNVIVQP